MNLHQRLASQHSSNDCKEICLKNETDHNTVMTFKKDGSRVRQGGRYGHN